jgi:cation:H+ antiporter
VWPSGVPLEANAAAFVLASAVVWVAGTRLAVYADVLAERTGWGHAYTGLVLLALTTDLPEIVTSIAAASSGEPGLAVNNLYGGVVANTAFLAIADASFGRGPLTFLTPSLRIVLQGLLVVALVSLTICGAIAGEPVAVGGVGLAAAGAFVLYLAFVRWASRVDPDDGWRPTDLPDVLHPPALRPARGRPSSRVWLRFSAAAAAVLVAGTALVGSASDLSVQTGLGAGLVGSTFLATATSLPELTTTLASVRIGAYAMAFGNVFGSNAVVVALLFVADVFDGGGPILRHAGASGLFVAAAGMGVTAVYLAGIVVRRRHTVARMGVDSLFVLLAYVATIATLVHVR